VRDRARDAVPGVALAEPLGDHPRVAAALLDRYRDAAARLDTADRPADVG
jgi:sirohydrochlorin ferrochelatase